MCTFGCSFTFQGWVNYFTSLSRRSLQSLAHSTSNNLFLLSFKLYFAFVLAKYLYINIFIALSLKVKVKSLSCVLLFATPWTVAHQVPLSMEYPRQEYWSWLPFPSPGNFPNPGIKPWSLALQADSLPAELSRILAISLLKCRNKLSFPKILVGSRGQKQWVWTQYYGKKMNITVYLGWEGTTSSNNWWCDPSESKMSNSIISQVFN